MKKLLFIIVVLLSLSCNKNKWRKLESIRTDVHITDVNVYKYSKVQGYIIYKGIKMDVDNGNTGYYHKKYDLYPGDIIRQSIVIYMKEDYNNDPYKNDVVLSTSDLNLTYYERK